MTQERNHHSKGETMSNPTPDSPRNIPAVSVIIPAYNQARYVRKSIQSVFDQTYPDFELIVVDDGSTDETPQILASIHDPRMRVVRQQNAGLSAARNTGLRESSAPLVTLLDSDDFFLPDKLYVLKEYLDTHADIGMVSGGTQYVDQDDQVFAEAIESTGSLDLPAILFRNPFTPSAVMVRREWFDTVGMFDETLRACEDWNLWQRMAYAGCQFAWVNHPVTAYRFHRGQMTRESDRMRIAIFSTMDKFFCQPDLPEKYQAIKDDAYASAYVHSTAYAYNAMNFEKGQEYLGSAMRLKPSLKENRYQSLVKLLVAWSNDPRSTDPTTFLQRIIENPPPGEPGLRQALRQALGDVILAPFFSGTRETWRAHRKDLLRAIYYNPRWLLNRGVLRMLVEAWVL
jgi:glycosyltransferase involved in cell wall biosynthesis